MRGCNNVAMCTHTSYCKPLPIRKVGKEVFSLPLSDYIKKYMKG